MKKVLAIVLALVLVLALAACGGSGGGDAPAPAPAPTPAATPDAAPAGDPSEVYTLKLHSHDPAPSPSGLFLKAWSEDIMAASGGRLVIDVYYGATLGGPRDTLEMIENGTCDIGWGLPSFFPGVFPCAEVLMLPMTGLGTAKQASQIMWDLYESSPAMQAEFSKYKVLLLHANTQSPISSRNMQFETVDDLRGKNIRGNGGPPTDFITAMGAAPVGVPITELFEAINNGTIDAVITDWSAIDAFQLFETCKYYADVDIGPSNYFLMMNWDSYNNLPADLQQIIDDRSGWAALEYCGTEWDESDARVRQEIANRGDVIYKLDPAEQAKLQAIADGVVDAWVEAKEAAGLPGQELVDALKAGLSKY